MSKAFKEHVHRISCRACDTRRSEIDHLTSRGVDSYKKLVAAALNEKSDVETRRIGAWVLGRLPARKSGSKAVIVLLQDKDTQVRARAANSAGKLKLKPAVPVLIEMLDCADEKQAMAALTALGEIKGNDAANALLEILESSDDLIKRWEAAKALPNFSSTKVTKKLVRLLKHESHHVREAAAYTLGFKGDTDAVAPLIKRACDVDELDLVRAQALEAIGYLAPGRTAVAHKLVSLLRSTKIEVRFWTAFALAAVAKPGNKTVIHELERLVKTDNALLTGWWTVAEEAAYALDCIHERDHGDRDWIDESFPASMKELVLPTGDKITRNGHSETLLLTTGDSLTTSKDDDYNFISSEEYVIHQDQPGRSIVIEYKNGNNIAFTDRGVVQLLRDGKNMRIRRDADVPSPKKDT